MTESPIVRRAVVVPDRDPNGLHMRPAQLIVEIALQYRCKIDVIRDDLRIDAKNIFDVFLLRGEPGTTLSFEAQGEDAQAAVDQLAEFIESGFTSYESKSQP